MAHLAGKWPTNLARTTFDAESSRTFMALLPPSQDALDNYKLQEIHTRGRPEGILDAYVCDVDLTWGDMLGFDAARSVILRIALCLCVVLNDCDVFPIEADVIARDFKVMSDGLERRWCVWS